MAYRRPVVRPTVAAVCYKCVPFGKAERLVGSPLGNDCVGGGAVCTPRRWPFRGLFAPHGSEQCPCAAVSSVALSSACCAPFKAVCAGLHRPVTTALAFSGPLV